MQPIIIIGTGLAGFNFVKEFRKLNKEQSIVMITSDDGNIYSKPMLSAGFTKNKTPDALVMSTPEKLKESFNVDVLTHTTVTNIDTQAKTVSYNGQAHSYSKLIIAQGADTFKPPIKGNAANEAISVNDLMDYRKFREQLEGKKHILIMGGGLIGCEFANDLSSGGFSVTVVEPMGRLLPQLIPPAASQAVENGLKALNVNFIYGQFVESVDKTEHGYQVSLTDGDKPPAQRANTQVTADLVVSAVGLRPRVALAQEAGIKTARGIVVDRTLQTSAEDIYALGDCIEISELILPYVMPLMNSARALAKTLNGETTEVTYDVMPVTVKTPCCPLVANPPPANTEGEWQSEIDSEDPANTKSLFIDTQGNAIGYVVTGTFIKEKMALNKGMPAILG